MPDKITGLPLAVLMVALAGKIALLAFRATIAASRGERYVFTGFAVATSGFLLAFAVNA